jgi:putative glutamine amidotransferase
MAAGLAGPRPLVLLPSDNQHIGPHAVHLVWRQYVQAVRLAGALPVVVPPCSAEDIEDMLVSADGVLLTGSPSNVHPAHFGEAVRDPSLPLDPDRDAWTLPLVRRVLALGVPLLAICRGAQEANVALGGSLHQAVHEVPGHADHRGPGGPRDGEPLEVEFGPAHPVAVRPGGVLHAVTGLDTFVVNSVHGQAVHQLAPGLQVEAHAPDGLVEAFSVEGAAGFNLCLQWHPEWEADDNPVSMQILRAFGQAVRAQQQRRLGRA